MTKQEIKETIQDEIELGRREFRAARAELYREQSMYGGDGPWNDYGEDYVKPDPAWVKKRQHEQAIARAIEMRDSRVQSCLAHGNYCWF
jgi:hypothetical protein